MATGQDVTVRVSKDSVLQSVFGATRSATFDPGLETEEDRYVGEKVARMRQTVGVVSLSIPFDPDSTEYMTLLNIQRQKAKHNPDFTNVRIDVTFKVDWLGTGGVNKIQMRNCVISEASIEVGAQQDLVGSSPTFMSGDWELLS